MKFWDSSALVPLLALQENSEQMASLLREDPAMLVWWGAEVECASAISRLERQGSLTPEQADTAFGRLEDLSQSWHEINPVGRIKESAIRFLRVHVLRAADALQLAAAFHAAETRPATLEFVCLDERLVAAAHKEGFRVVN